MGQGKSWSYQMDRRTLPYKLTYGFLLGSHAAIPGYLSVYLQELGCSPAQIGLILSPRTLCGFLGGFFIWQVTPRHLTPRTTFIATMLAKLCIVYLIGILPAPNFSEKACECNPSFTVSTSKYNNSPLDYAAHRKTPLVEKEWVFDSAEVNTNVAIITLLLCLLDLVYAGSHGLLDSLTLDALGSDRQDEYAHQRVLGTVLHAVVSLFCGALSSVTRYILAICGSLVIFINYHLVFYVYIVFDLLGVVSAGYFEDTQLSTTEHVDDSEKKAEDVRRTISSFISPTVILWIFVTFELGAVFGVKQAFLYWHMQNCGASPLLIGIAIAVKLLAEFVMFLLIPRLIQLIGQYRMMALTLIITGVKMTMYAIVKNPMLFLPVILLDGILYTTKKCAIVKFAATISTRDFGGPVQAMFSAFSILGVGFGSLIGGRITNSYGASTAFLFFAILSVFTFVIFSMSSLFPDCKKDNKDEQQPAKK